MSKIKTYYHKELLRHQRNPAYRATLPVSNGVIQDPTGLIASLRRDAWNENAYRNYTRVSREMSGQPEAEYWKEQRLDLKWRGPRKGNRYNTRREDARAVDIYMRERTIWADERRS